MLSLTLYGDLDTPNIILFSGNNCSFLNPIYCARDDSGQNSLTVTLSLVPGITYYLMVSGGSLSDQGEFTLSFSSYRNCSPCLLSASLSAFPPSVNGVYSAGQKVTYCLTIDGWNVTGTIEWLHSVVIELGSGWDLNTLTYTAPASCGGDGFWDWYTSWTGCNTGNTFGPGFAYDSSSGFGCGGAPNDSIPGNNWGDGRNACANIADVDPFVFCWTITVADPLPDTLANNLNVLARVFSDGDSGSWTQTGCNTGIEYQIMASAIPFTDLPPLGLGRAPFCAAECNGQLHFSGASATGDTIWDYMVFDEEQELIYQFFETEGAITLDSLCIGTYTILITNPVSGSSRAISVDVPAPGTSWVQDQDAGCAGLVATYSAGVQDTSLTYYWVFEGGHPATASDAEVAVSYSHPGIYATTLIAGNGICNDTIRVEQAVSILNEPVANFDLELESGTIHCNNTSLYSADYQWIFGDGATSTETYPVHTFSESGDYLVQLVAGNTCGSDTFSRIVQITLVNAKEPMHNMVCKLYPNPNNGRFMLEMQASPAPWAEIKLFDALGQVVYTETVGFQSGELQKPVAQENLSAGIYWLSMKTQDFNITRKVIVEY